MIWDLKYNEYCQKSIEGYPEANIPALDFESWEDFQERYIVHHNNNLMERTFTFFYKNYSWNRYSTDVIADLITYFGWDREEFYMEQDDGGITCILWITNIAYNNVKHISVVSEKMPDEMSAYFSAHKKILEKFYFEVFKLDSGHYYNYINDMLKMPNMFTYKYYKKYEQVFPCQKIKCPDCRTRMPPDDYNDHMSMCMRFKFYEYYGDHIIYDTDTE